MIDGVESGTTVDAFLGGRVEAVQPKRGHHRSGLEAVLLAAALPSRTDGTIVDLGSGAGIAGFCAAVRCPAASVLLVEREAELVGLARDALGRPENAGFAARVAAVELDITTPEAQRVEAGLPRGAASALITNPPFFTAGEVRASPNAARAAAHVLPDGLGPWFRVAASALAPKGLLVAIIVATALPDALASLDGRFGRVSILPIHPRASEPAHRVLLAARRGSRGAMALLPGLVLHHGPSNGFAANVEAILRGEAGLATAHPPWLLATEAR